MIVDLIRVTTADGVRLDGAVHAASAQSPKSCLPVDALLCVHGTGGSFYTSAIFEDLALRLTAQGVAVLRINTRGHDLVSTAATAAGGKRQGAAYELVDHCRHDLRAWLDWLHERGFRRVCLVGHSLGAVKSIYTLARHAHSAVVALVAISPPRLSHAWFAASAKRDEFLSCLSSANDYVQRGQPNTLLDVRFPLPFLVTAAGYLEKYGPDERYNFLPLIENIACPLLFTFGGEEVANNVAFQNLPDAVKQLGVSKPAVHVTTVADADHFYTRHRPQLIDEITAWLERLELAPAAEMSKISP